MPVAVIDAAGLTDMRTGAVTALGAKSPRAQGQPRARAHRRARHRVLERAPARPPVRLRRDPRAFAPSRESRDAFAARLSRDLGKPVIATTDWEIVRARRRHRGRGLAPRRARAAAEDRVDQARGAFVVPYGTMSAVELSLTDIMDKIVVDDWGQCRRGCLRGAARARRRRQAERANLHAELGEIVAGAKPGRESDDETILLWHRGPVALRHRARRGDARQGERALHRPDAAYA